MEKEKRKYKRVKFKNYVNLINKDEKFKVKSIDVSQKGMFISTHVFNVGDKLIAIFSVLLNIPFRRDGIVVRKNTEGIGIQFLK